MPSNGRYERVIDGGSSASSNKPSFIILTVHTNTSPPFIKKDNPHLEL